MVIDTGKGWLGRGSACADLPLVGIDPSIDRLWLAVACAAAVVVGHVYPVWYGFRGGKGAATLRRRAARSEARSRCCRCSPSGWSS